MQRVLRLIRRSPKGETNELTMNHIPSHQSDFTTDKKAIVVPESNAQIEDLDDLCRHLMKTNRDPSSIAIASEVTEAYQNLNLSDRCLFMTHLNRDYDVNSVAISSAASNYQDDPTFKNLQSLAKLVETPRQKLFSCINAAPDGLETLVRMRQDLLEFDLPIRIALGPVEEDLKSLLHSWFNRGFLRLQRIDWSSPASLLEKLIEHEAVHQISHWDDLRRRLQDDRRCYAFFHPAMETEPLVFVEVALTHEISGNINELINIDSEVADSSTADTAMFYSISSCQRGLRGISFGGLLIKQVVNELRSDLPGIKTFSTLSPVSSFSRWLSQQDAEKLGECHCVLSKHANSGPTDPDELRKSLEPYREPLMELMAEYLIDEQIDGRPIDSVARFHLGNGSQLRAIHWMADVSENGMTKSLGMMVNYVYDLDQIQSNRQNFLQHKIIAAHPTIHSLAKRRSARSQK